MKIKKYYLFLFLLAISLFFVLGFQAQAQTPTQDAIQYNASLNNGGGWSEGIQETENFGLPNATPYDIITNILNWILSIFAVLAVLAFVISGVMFLTSGGNQDMTSRAKDYIKYSIIAIAVALSGFIIINFIDNILMGFIW
jgi:hypothetical protein